jgi:hypothetical protein
MGQWNIFWDITMKLDWTINMGELIAAFVLAASFFTAHTNSIRKLQEMKTKLDMIYSWFERQIVHAEHAKRE